MASDPNFHVDDQNAEFDPSAQDERLVPDDEIRLKPGEAPSQVCDESLLARIPGRCLRFWIIVCASPKIGSRRTHAASQGRHADNCCRFCNFIICRGPSLCLVFLSCPRCRVCMSAACPHSGSSLFSNLQQANICFRKAVGKRMDKPFPALPLPVREACYFPEHDGGAGESQSTLTTCSTKANRLWQ